MTESPVSLAPPTAEQRPKTLSTHGHDRADPWYWLGDREDPATIAYLEAENAYTSQETAHLEPLIEKINAEIVSRVQETDISVPGLNGDFWYYSKTVEGLSYAIFCRKAIAGEGVPALADRPKTGDDLPGEEFVVLDQNALAEGHDFFSLGAMSVSVSGRYLAYSTDTNGSEKYTLHVRDLSTGTDLPDSVEEISGGATWSADDTAIFYTRPDEAQRPYQLFRHLLGTPATDDVLVYTEHDQQFGLGVGRTKDNAYLMMVMGSKLTTEFHLLDAHNPTGEFQVVEPRRSGISYDVDHQNGRLLIVTDEDAVNSKLMETPVATPGRAHWSEMLAHRDTVRLEGIDVFDDFLVIVERGNASRFLRIMATPGGRGVSEPTTIEMPEAVGTVSPQSGHTTADHVLRFGYSSMVTPASVFDLDMRTGERRLVKQQPVLGGYDASSYVTGRVWATASDGTAIPMTIVHSKDLVLDGSAPLLLNGYGSYEMSYPATFSSPRLSLLERGFVVAIAHVRGGGEMGRAWYDDGKMLNKSNTFTDFIGCADKLISDGYTSTDRLVARGASAGGLLMGAIANLAPATFKAIVAEVPFVDALTTMLDESLPLTAGEWEEWGNPITDPATYHYMAGYSPYDNVTAQDYPALLITGGLNDPRVGYWEPAKWTQRLRQLNTGGAPLLLKTEMGAGHSGPSGRYSAWRDEAFVYSFILDSVGVTD